MTPESVRSPILGMKYMFPNEMLIRAKKAMKELKPLP